jgi:hypothetical protein
MVFFSAILNEQIITDLVKMMPSDSFCLFRDESGKEVYYGVVKDSLYQKFLECLPGTTLESLEYLDADEFKQLVKTMDSSDAPFSCLGNPLLLA